MASSKRAKLKMKYACAEHAWKQFSSNANDGPQEEINRAAFLQAGVELKTTYCACCWWVHLCSWLQAVLAMEKIGEWVRLSSDIMRSFTGEGDVVVWLNKLKLVAKLQKTEDVVTLILMYLQENAIVVYLEMGEKDQADAERIKTKDGIFGGCFWSL